MTRCKRQQLITNRYHIVYFSEMDGAIVSNDWFGGLNVTYRTGPGYKDKRLVVIILKLNYVGELYRYFNNDVRQPPMHDQNRNMTFFRSFEETAKYVPKDISVKQLDCNDTCLCHSYLARKELSR